MAGSDDAGTVLICNPASGNGDHADRVAQAARDLGYAVRLTESEGDAVRFAREAAVDGAPLVVAAGGDGTINEVVNGLVDADALYRTTLAVVPTGTGNNFASNVGVETIDEAFDAIETGQRRRIDLGIAKDRAFVNSCVGGVTAQASAATTAEEKGTFGVLAYVRRTVETAASFDPLPIRATLENGDETRSPDADAENAPGGPEANPDATSGSDRSETWAGEATFVLVGNCRRFTTARRAQADVEDGLFEVTIVEDATPVDLVGDVALAGLLDREGGHVVRQRVPALTLESLRDGPIQYSLDGEILAAETLTLETRPRALEVVVGDGYRIDPDESDSGA